MLNLSNPTPILIGKKDTNMVSEAYKTSSSINSTNSVERGKRVCGLIMVDDRLYTRSSSLEMDIKSGICLGSIVLDKENYSGDELRKLINNQLSGIPKTFLFLSKEG